MISGFEAQLGNLLGCGVWFQEGVINHSGNTRIFRNASKGRGDTGRSGINDTPHPVITCPYADIAAALLGAVVAFRPFGAPIMLGQRNHHLTGDYLYYFFYV